MGRFASATTVSVERSRAEIEATLRKYKASEFVSGWKEDCAMIGFRISELFIQFVLPLPDKGGDEFRYRTVRGCRQRATESQAEAAYEQVVRQRWRAMNLVVKAKLEAVECGISTIEKEFLAFIVLPGGATIGDWLIDSNGLEQIRAGKMPLALAPARGEEVEDAEATVVPFKQAGSQ